ncbi:uncharacterized protein LOC133739244 [Rosa rugosa]|uniref:uncharacterized protein LOC133739244 n=1 Tax=Rosa rugosa TaxID=74645 RepID=UPI002B418003|nr:uncharacterized protein LOC133739244 [Rosa rugosa]
MAAKPEETELRRHLRHQNGEGQAFGPISDMEKDRQIRSRRWRQRSMQTIICIVQLLLFLVCIEIGHCLDISNSVQSEFESALNLGSYYF